MNSILDRKLGGSYPISIGTSLALETIGRPSKPEAGHSIPDMPIPIERYGAIAISVNTLIKNLIESIDPNHLPKGTFDTATFILDQVDQELSVIKEVVHDANRNMIVSPYVNTFSVLNSILAKYDKRRTFSGKVGDRHALYLFTLKVAITRDYTIWNTNVNLRLISPGFKVMVLTSFPIDIVNNERTATILESHTGVVRMYNTFYKKLYKTGKVDMTIVPFNIITLLLFGDKYNILPDPIGVRREFLALSSEKNFQYNTTKRKILDEIARSDYANLKITINKFKNL